jgi:hypothetical protein
MSVLDGARYVYDELVENYDDSWWWRKRIAARLLKPVHAHYPGFDDAVRVMEKDWDTLVVLDACRADLFEQVADLGRFDDYRRVRSLGSATAEWTERNFAGGSFGDTVYVASNPHTSNLAGNAFHELVEVWREAFDDDHRTVLPEPVTAAALDAHERHPDKRLVVHYMQPHRPFVEAETLQYEGWHPDWHDGPKNVDGIKHPFHALEAGLATKREVCDAYADNLELVIDDVISLASVLDGRTVLTSDHGNLLGERVMPVPVRMYAHPRGVRHPGLVDVPWAVHDSGGRRETTDEGTTRADELDTQELESRLADLGYG